VRRFGAERFLFGTGFPEQYPEASVLPLLHAGISEADKRKIASGNFEALLKRIRL
jgi:predicted TIM-barrel fold metal-dependent hydrolase